MQGRCDETVAMALLQGRATGVQPPSRELGAGTSVGEEQHRETCVEACAAASPGVVGCMPMGQHAGGEGSPQPLAPSTRHAPTPTPQAHHAPSRPGVAGSSLGVNPGYTPMRQKMSAGLMGRQLMRTSASPGPGVGMGTLAITTLPKVVAPKEVSCRGARGGGDALVRDRAVGKGLCSGRGRGAAGPGPSELAAGLEPGRPLPANQVLEL
jgi:hypothetical protein